jgi:co-chaperonin GroES (HSP10)
VKIRPVSDWLLVELEPEEHMSRGGIIEVGDQPVRNAKVLRVGPGRQYKKNFVPTVTTAGDRICFFVAALHTKQGKAIVHNLDDNQGLIRETDVLLVFTDASDIRVSA